PPTSTPASWTASRPVRPSPPPSASSEKEQRSGSWHSRAPSRRPSSTCSKTNRPVLSGPHEEPMTGPGYASDARTLSELLAFYEAEGFTAQFGTRPGGNIICFSCHVETPADECELVSLSRTEGA